MPLAPDSRLGPYEIVAHLGAGGMGEVYRARDTRLGRDIALKLLPDAVARDPDRLARLEREARAVAALNHPNIVTLHSLEESGGVRFLTMELVEGQSLDRMIASNPLPVGRALEIAIALAEALVAAHERGVVHRDLKPGNVMVTRDGRVKVLDFGLAKLAQNDFDAEATQAETAVQAISEPGRTVGTVPYMAPEQLLGQPVDARADLFSFGIVLHELLVGRRPFAGATSAEVTSAILRDSPPRVTGLRADLPRDLDRIVTRCLEKDPRDRFQTARDVYNELRYLGRQTEGAPSGAVGREPASAASGVAISKAPAPSSSGSPTPTSSEARRAAPSIAVLPFANRSRDEEDEYFADGLADELLNVLAKVRGLRVAARTSAFQFKGKNEDLEVIGRKLNVATLLEGSVRKSGHRVRITVQLVKVEDGYQLWSETYDRTLEDIFAVQDDIAQAVVKELRTTLMGEAVDSKASGEARAEVAEAMKGRGASAEAHRLFLQGRHLVDRLNRPDNERGVAYLREAVALDPTHALAWSALSRAHMNQAGYGWDAMDHAFALAREAAERAIAAEPSLAEGHAMLGRLLTLHEWDWKAADASFRRALELAPGSAEVLQGAGLLAHALGRPEEALRLGRRAVDQDPLSPAGYSTIGYACRALDRNEEALAAYRKVLELAPQRVGGRTILCLVLIALGRPEEALAAANDEVEDWARLCAVSIAHHARGDRAASDAALRELTDHHAETASYQIAGTHAARQEWDAAFHWLDQAHERRDPGLTWVKLEPLYRPAHADPRWRAFLEKMGLAE